jgi:hypothetical protein
MGFCRKPPDSSRGKESDRGNVHCSMFNCHLSFEEGELPSFAENEEMPPFLK